MADEDYLSAMRDPQGWRGRANFFQAQMMAGFMFMPRLRSVAGQVSAEAAYASSARVE
ncbi:MAG: hypothetical protein V7640_82 [Betaproteobacteria bacterium]